MNLNQWAIKWNIPIEALNDLQNQFGMIDLDSDLIEGASEAAVQTQVRLEASQKGVTLFRNNVGAFKSIEGRVIRYGLANESKDMNKILKSSDLIGIRPITISMIHIGQTIGQFVARETKHAEWIFSGSEHEQAQLKFLEFIASKGGDASFTTGEGTL